MQLFLACCSLLTFFLALQFTAVCSSHLLDKKSLLKQPYEIDVPSIPFAEQPSGVQDDESMQPRATIGNDKIKLKKKIKNTNKKTKKVHKNKAVSILTCSPTYNSQTTERLGDVSSPALAFPAVNQFSPSSLLTEQFFQPQHSLLASLASAESLLPPAGRSQVTELTPFVNLISQSLGLRQTNLNSDLNPLFDEPASLDDDLSKREPVTVVEETISTDGKTASVAVDKVTEDSQQLLAHQLIAAQLSPLKLEDLFNLSELLIARILSSLQTYPVSFYSF